MTATHNVADTISPLPSTVIAGSQKEKRQCIELGFVEKLIELWRLRRRILKDKTEILVSGTLASTLTKQAMQL